jgi:hypothetical protein
MALFVHTLEEMHDELNKINGHFSSGFKNDLMEHMTDQSSNITEKLDRALTTTYLIKDAVDKSTEFDSLLTDKAYDLTNEIKDKISGLKGDIDELKTSIKIDRATNLIGLGTFIIGILTIILKVYDKI